MFARFWFLRLTILRRKNNDGGMQVTSKVTMATIASVDKDILSMCLLVIILVARSQYIREKGSHSLVPQSVRGLLYTYHTETLVPTIPICNHGRLASQS